MGDRPTTAFPPAAAWWADDAGALTALSPRWEQLTGREIEKELGSGWLDCVHPEDLGVWHGELREAREAAGELSCDVRVRGPRADWIWLRMTALPELGSDGTLRGFVGSALDVSDLKRVQQELFTELRRLNRVERDLEQQFGAALHDLQQPLRNLIHTLDGTGPAEGPAVQGWDRARELAGSLQQLMRELFDYAHVGRDAAPAEPTEPGLAIRRACDHLSELIETRGAELSVDVLPPVRCDPVQLARIFQNLLANALLHAGPGVQLRIWAEREVDEVAFGVSDDGAGIPPEEHERIFQVFHRLCGDRVPGSGMGLAVCRKLVEMSGGRIWVESEPGQGATFRFTIPAC